MSESIGIEGYRIQKHVYYDNPNKNIANWKSRKLLARGKYTLFDDVVKESKQKVSPQLYAKQEDWKTRETST